MFRLSIDISAKLKERNPQENWSRIFYNNNFCTVAYLLVFGLRICNRNAVDIWTNLKLSFVTHLYFLAHITTFFCIRLPYASLITIHVASGCGESGIGLCGLSWTLKAVVSSETTFNSISVQSYHINLLFSSEPL